MRIGVFGGTFDPPHTGHALVAGDACETLGLDTVLWIPAAHQPLKDAPPLAPASDRRRMVELAINGDPRFSLDTVELDRGGLSFTVDTLEALAKRQRGAQLVLLVGADAWASFDRWRDPERILSLAEVAVIARAGESPRTVSGHTPTVVTARCVDVSSTEIRDRVRRGLPITGFVSDAVREHITAAGLYR
ncbi:MAG: nicotinate-nucleotide adenylyltransferase [Gemmatimonadaceae bacterium]